MLMTLKNKMLMGMNKMITETRGKGGMPATINLEPLEAAELLKELQELRESISNDIRFVGAHGTVDIRFILKQELTKERLLELINQWYKHEFVIFYKDVELQIIKKGKGDMQEKKPKPPTGRIIQEGSVKLCSLCGSSLHKKYKYFGEVNGCIQPECNNYYRRGC